MVKYNVKARSSVGSSTKLIPWRFAGSSPAAPTIFDFKMNKGDGSLKFF